jgi:hypothetical protein
VRTLALLALVLGLLLAVARLRTGGLWLSVGIQAAWVAVFRVGRLFLDIRKSPAWLVGPGWRRSSAGPAAWWCSSSPCSCCARRCPLARDCPRARASLHSPR